VLVFGATLAVMAAAWLGASPRMQAPIDFTAFYCGAHTTAHGLDPYLAKPLEACESAAVASVGGAAVTNLVVPAPLPPYALVSIAPLGLLAFGTARTLWIAALLLASGVTVVLLRRLTHLPLALLVAGIFSADAIPSILIGQIVPLIVAALAGAALALQAGRPRFAALLASCTLLEPHVGLPACLGLFVWERRARVPLLAALGALGLLSFLGGGIERSLEYAFLVLPAHARAEGLEFGGQYSLSAALAQLGVPDGVALELGSLSYFGMTLLGGWAGSRLVRLVGSPAPLVLAAPAFALFGGVHVHIHQMAAALPIAFLLLSRCRSQRLVLALAVGLLAVPWEMLAECGLLPTAASPASHPDPKIAMGQAADGNRLAEDAWAVWVRSGARDGRTPLERLAVKLPTWIGLALLLGVAVRPSKALAVTLEQRPKREPVGLVAR
jgi:hypothetical protein